MTDTDTDTFSIRQLSPFGGTIQVVRTEYARALSADGKQWQIQVTCESHQQQWGLHASEVERRYVVYGNWSRQHGLYTIPLDPMLDVPDRQRVESNIVQGLSDVVNHLPFRQGDLYELWLLDDNNQPLALLASCREESHIPSIKLTRWRGSNSPTADFSPPPGDLSGTAMERLENLIHTKSNDSTRHQWFQRDTVGNARALSWHSDQVEPVDFNHAQFPELLINEKQADETLRQLVIAYHDWLAPRCLLLQNLSTPTRQRLEIAAQNQAVLVKRLHHLYPAIVDQKIMNRILVEAKLRESGRST